MKIKAIKQIIFYFLFTIIVIIITSILKINNDKETNKKADSANANIYIPYDYKEYSKIKLYHTKDNKIEEMDLDTYLLGVVASEMPATFEEEALKAQAIVARTYTIYQISKANTKKHGNADICDSSLCCQAWISKDERFSRWEKGKENEYWNKIERSVYETKGKMIYYNRGNNKRIIP